MFCRCTCTFETNLGLSRHKGIFHNTQAHDYLQRKIRFIRNKAVSSVVKAPPPASLRNDSILKNRLQGQSSSGNRFLTPAFLAARALQKTLPRTSGVNLQALKNFKGSGRSVVQAQPSPPVKIEEEFAAFQCGHCSLSFPSLNHLR